MNGGSSGGVLRPQRCLEGGGWGGGGRRLSALLKDVMGFPSVINDSHLRAESAAGRSSIPVRAAQRQAPGAPPALTSAPALPLPWDPPGPGASKGPGAPKDPVLAGPLSLPRPLLHHAPLQEQGPGASSPTPGPIPQRCTDPASRVQGARTPQLSPLRTWAGGVSGACLGESHLRCPQLGGRGRAGRGRDWSSAEPRPPARPSQTQLSPPPAPRPQRRSPLLSPLSPRAAPPAPAASAATPRLRPQARLPFARDPPRPPRPASREDAAAPGMASLALWPVALEEGKGCPAVARALGSGTQRCQSARGSVRPPRLPLGASELCAAWGTRTDRFPFQDRRSPRSSWLRVRGTGARVEA